MDRLGGLVVIMLARKAGDPGSNPGPGENFSLKLLKTSVIVKIFQLSFHVFVCAFRPEISSFFSKSFPCLFQNVLCFPYLDTFLSTG